MIEVKEQLAVAAEPATVWRLLTDPYTVIGCVPGAGLAGQDPSGAREVLLTARFGALGMTFQTFVNVDLDAAAMRGRLRARGKDQENEQFQANGSFSVTPSGSGSGSLVSVGVTVEVWGHLAATIEETAGAVIHNLATEFVTCLSAQATPAHQRPEAQ
jgi:carbon monoxide dehydrogenase subunit G